ncbi:MAG: choice-of-anchor tandem repeat GloVer-containing protein [Candidatus Cybelea sp.]
MILRVVSMSIAVALAACSNSEVSSPVPLDGFGGTHVALQPASHERNAASEAVIYDFGGKTPDGTAPNQTLTDVRGTLYGETYGNTGSKLGTIFTVTPLGSETVLHTVIRKQGLRFSQLVLGPRPTGGGLSLYGTGKDGGAYSYGTIVRVTLSGAVIVLHSFTGGADGAHPAAGLVNVNGTFYGTTRDGGVYSHGTVFSVTPSGTENVIYAFRGATQDGGQPEASLVNLNGTLYGTTVDGGSSRCGGPSRCGTVFSVTASGTEHVLHSFQGGSDGEYPQAGLIAVDGTLYGTTAVGGGAGCSMGCGTVFSITPSGTQTILHRFTGGADGVFPAAMLLALNGKMFGTTQEGGNGCISGCGTVFSITPSGTETILHRFTGGANGWIPYGGLINIHATLYGVTGLGGTYNDGTVYSITL